METLWIISIYFQCTFDIFPKSSELNRGGRQFNGIPDVYAMLQNKSVPQLRSDALQANQKRIKCNGTDKDEADGIKHALCA